MKRPRLLIVPALGLLFSLLHLTAFALSREAVILSPREASWAETLAAREIRRYLYLCTGQLFPITTETGSLSGSQTVIVVARKDRPLLRLLNDSALTASLRTLAPENYLLRTLPAAKSTLRPPPAPLLVLAGGDEAAVLYAAYRFAEHLGVRFYLDGDVFPDEPIPWHLPSLNEQASPLFALRGIQPFHDFPEGPDWWNRDDYLAIIGQLPKLRMNFIGLHTYPEGRPNAEPTVWLGLSEDMAQNGKVKFSYPASYQNTLRGNWGYATTLTGDYPFGTRALFARDDFGPDVLADFVPSPSTSEACNEVFERTAALLREAFTFAHKTGVRTCVGTETPLVIPRVVEQRLASQKRAVSDPATLQALYEGVFRRAAQAYPLDYYWFWTPEDWTWRGTKEEQVRATTNDLAAAIAAYRKVKPPFRLATCGWVLGPQQDRALFDKFLPKEMPLSCINREVGKTPVEPGFALVKGRSKWAIPWLEDDPGLTVPQLWVGRMRRDAADALRYGCDGLMGLHWRTRVLGPNVGALAQAAWSQHPWLADYHPASASNGVFAATKDFYEDWATHQFGRQVGLSAAAIFQKLDGKLPVPASWVNGPGGIKPDPRPWNEVAGSYSFVNDLEALRPRVKGAGNQERFDYWLNTFRYLRAMGEVNCAWSEYRRAVACVKAAKSLEAKKEIARIFAFPVRHRLLRELEQLYACLLATVSTPGELGTVANWNQHNLPGLLAPSEQELTRLLNEPLPPEAQPARDYHGPLRLIVPTKRTSVASGEQTTLQVLILSEQPPRNAALFWRHLGQGPFVRVPLQHLARGVYTVDLGSHTQDFEYYLQAELPGGQTAFFPATAPRLNQTVVLTP